MIEPLKILNDAIKKVPFVKYALGVAGICAAIAIIRSFGIDNYQSIPILSILIMMGFMILLFVFSMLTKSKDLTIKIAGSILVFTTVIIACLSSILLTLSVFFDIPKPITSYGIFVKDEKTNESIKTNNTEPYKKSDNNKKTGIKKSPTTTKILKQRDTIFSQTTHNGYNQINDSTSVFIYNNANLIFHKIKKKYLPNTQNNNIYYISEPLTNIFYRLYCENKNILNSTEKRIDNKIFEKISRNEIENLSIFYGLKIPTEYEIENAEFGKIINLEKRHVYKQSYGSRYVLALTRLFDASQNSVTLRYRTEPFNDDSYYVNTPILVRLIK